jgi:hypothetical protein
VSPAKRVYEPRIFDGRVLFPEQEQIHEEISKFERMEYGSPPMHELIMDVWPELAHKPRTHLTFRIDKVDPNGEIFEHLVGHRGLRAGDGNL